MAYEFKLPDLGEGIHEGEIKKWLVKEGDKVKSDQPIAELETDKAVVEMPSPKGGVVLKLFGKEGEKIKVGQVLIVIGQEGEKYEQRQEAIGSKQEAIGRKHEAPQASSLPPKPDGPKSQTEITIPQETSTGRAMATPFVRKLARELGVDIEKIKGTGEHGRISEQDIRNASKGGYDFIKQEAVGSKQEGPTIYDLPPKPVQRIPIIIEGEVERLPFRGVRRTVAEHMVTSMQTAMHVTHVDEIDVSDLVRIREQEKAYAEQKGVKLTYLPFIIKAIVAALRQFPVFNSSLDEEKSEMVLKKYYNIGIAVDTEDGLIVPVLKNADKKTIINLGKEIAELAEKARSRKLTLDELRGGTFTITNIGSIGGVFATPIINYPEVAILGIYRMQDKVAVVEDKAEIRKMMNISLTFDHRVIDGALAARFAVTIKKHLEDPGLLLVDE